MLYNFVIGSVTQNVYRFYNFVIGSVTQNVYRLFSRVHLILSEYKIYTNLGGVGGNVKCLRPFHSSGPI